jgi:MFS family permease
MTSANNRGFRENLELFKNRDFAILWAGFTFSGLGDSIYYIARIALIIKLTGSALAAGGMTVFGILPTIFMSLTGGALADRLNRQKLVVWSNFARGLIMLVLAWLIYAGLVQYWHLYIIAFINNSFYAISNPAFDAMLPSVVETSQLKNAYSSFSIGSNFAQIAGPALAGLLVITTGTGGAIFVNGVSFFIMMFALMLIRPKLENLATNKKRSSITSVVIEGWAYARNNNVLMIFLLSLAFLNLLGASMTVGVPFFVTRTLQLDLSWYGTVIIGVNVGVILGGFMVSSLDIKHRGLVVCFTTIGVGVAIAFTFGFLHSIWFIVVGVAVISILFSFSSILIPTWIQTAVTDEYRGRIFSIMSMISYSLTPIGLTVFGLLLDHFDASYVIAISGLGIIGVGLWLLSKKDLRQLL